MKKIDITYYNRYLGNIRLWVICSVCNNVTRTTIKEEYIKSNKCRFFYCENCGHTILIDDKLKKMVKQKMDDLILTESKGVEEGKYTAVIVDVEERETEKYGVYIDYTFQLENVNDSSDKPITLKCGFSRKSFTPKTALYKFLSQYKDIEMGGKISPTSPIGSKVSFLVQEKKTDNGTFANIVKDTIKRI